MPCEIKNQDRFVEIHVTGSTSHWDILKTLHALYTTDHRKETPDLWVLDRNLDFAMHSFPIITQGLLKLTSRFVKNGCKSAILAADEFQRSKLDLYCDEAAVLPYETQCFTLREEALNWLLD